MKREIVLSLKEKWISFLVWALFAFEMVILLSFIPVEEVAVAQNTTEFVNSLLTIGSVYPEVINVSINDGVDSVDLVANGTRQVQCMVVVQDYNSDGDIRNVTAALFDATISYGSTPDNNNYYNKTCALDRSYGDQYQALANCTFSIFYFANNATWNCTANVSDNASYSSTGFDMITFNELLALDLPTTINYGIVNVSEVSQENDTILRNQGNTMFNITLYGYARLPGDNLSMNCTLGNIKNISIGYEKYNLTISNNGTMNYSWYYSNYTNLTCMTNTTKKYGLAQRQNDTEDEAYNHTYWRIYVPLGVAGTCSGRVVFVATKSGENI
jgi:hypothetical protein